MEEKKDDLSGRKQGTFTASNVTADTPKNPKLFLDFLTHLEWWVLKF